MNKKQALELVATLAEASIRAYRVINGEAHGSDEVAVKKETKAAREIIKHLTLERVTDEEIDEVLG